ncbi:hypothetical protein OROMI_023445 [Orobanche minor]
MCHPWKPAEEEEEEEGPRSWSESESDDDDDIWPAKMGEEEEEGVWPPVWKPVEESPLYDTIHKYLEFGEDHYAHVYPPGSEKYDLIKRFIQQVRNSRGYDVDCIPPGLLLSPFVPYSYEECDFLFEKLEKMNKFVIQKINARAERHGEKYVYHKLLKLVSVKTKWRTYCISFTAKEVRPNPDIDVVKTVQALVFFKGPYYVFQLLEWRFKPEEGEGITPCYKHLL